MRFLIPSSVTFPIIQGPVGGRRPYLLIGGILVAVFFVVMWWDPKGDRVRVWFPTETASRRFSWSIFFSPSCYFSLPVIFLIPHGALGMEMTTDYHERTRLFSAKSFSGNLFAIDEKIIGRHLRAVTW